MAADTPRKRHSVMLWVVPWRGAAYPGAATAGERSANLKLYAGLAAAAPSVKTKGMYFGKGFGFGF